MTRREEFNLTFSRVLTPQGNIHHFCDSISSNNNQSLTIATILTGYDEKEDVEYLIKNLESAINGDFYDAEHQTDALAGSLRIIINSTNVTIDNYIFSIQSWKELMQEWLLFLSLQPDRADMLGQRFDSAVLQTVPTKKDCSFEIRVTFFEKNEVN